jgi:hypothetical protein
MKSKTLFIISFVISVHYCFAQRAFTDEQLKKELPKKEIKYKLSKQAFTLNDTSIVSSNAVYVLMLEEVERKNYEVVKRSNSYTFMRFFNDGRVFISFAYLSYPSAEEFNDLSYGKYGRYILKDGEIIIEFYQNRQYGVMFMFAKSVPTGVQFYATAYKMKALIKNRSTDGGYYKKDYPKLYNY